jgi:hypothetical protein
MEATSNSGARVCAWVDGGFKRVIAIDAAARFLANIMA